MIKSESITKIAAALVRAQRKMGAATKDAANPFFRSKYADLGSVMEVVKDPLNAEGITILQPVKSSEGSHFVETMLLHESGEFISSEPMRLELSKIDMQALGSAITYARRYTLQSLLSVPAEDDDGEATMSRTKSPAKNFEAAPKELKDAAKAALQKTAAVSNPEAPNALNGLKASVLTVVPTHTTTSATAPAAPKTTFRKSSGLNI